MAKRKRIQCIDKPDRNNRNERIRGIGGGDGLLSRWYTSLDDAIAEVESGQTTYYVQEKIYSVEVIVALHQGRKCLKTEPDGVTIDNLLWLPQCPQRV